MVISNWVRVPTLWIRESGLSELKWKSGGAGSDNTAALMSLVAIAHAANQDNGIAYATYDKLCVATGLSRAKLSNGLDVLTDIKVIERIPEGRSTYRLMNYDPKMGWGKLPAKSICSGDGILAFKELTLRRPAELNALKLFFLFVAFRDQASNMTKISYTKIEQYTGIERDKIKSGISLLASLSLIYVEHVPSEESPLGIANAYRIVGLESYNHMGTKSRATA
jgi:hypothetical protein